MPALIEDYALIGNCRSAALVSRDGAIDWLCLPRFDAPAVFAALLGNEENGRWRIAPSDPVEHCTRRYLDDTLVLETHWTTASGRARVLDCMPWGTATPSCASSRAWRAKPRSRWTWCCASTTAAACPGWKRSTR
jgi:GH15 family glucan-1,4-alpha-glucosidase